VARTRPTPPARSDDERRAALVKAAAAREARAALKAEVTAGEIDLSEVFARADDDDVVANIKVLTLLEALPYVGKIRSRRMMAELGISESRRLRGVGSRQRARLLETVAERG